MLLISNIFRLKSKPKQKPFLTTRVTCYCIGHVAQLGQSAGLLTSWSRVRIPSCPYQMRSILTEKPERKLTVENVRIDYHVKFPLAVLLTSILTIPWVLVTLSPELPTLPSLFLLAVCAVANLAISLIIVFQWSGSAIDKIAKRVFFNN